MDYLSILDQTVSGALAAGRVGVPVFVRWTAAVAATTVDLKPHLATMTVCTNRWLADSLQRLYATGAEQQGHLALTLDYGNGASALLALTLAHGHPHINLAIYGNQGALYHNEFIVPARDGDLTRQLHGDDDANRAQLMAALEIALVSQQPVLLTSGVNGRGASG